MKDKVIPEPTDIEIKGNYFHLKTRVPVPKEMFNSHRRLVLQPSIYDVTLKKRLLMRPVVFDGDTYNTTQNRMYDYDIDKDPRNCITGFGRYFSSVRLKAENLYSKKRSGLTVPRAMEKESR